MTYEVRANRNRETALIIARGPVTVAAIRLTHAGLTVDRTPAEEFDSDYRIIPTSHGHLSTPQDYARWALDPDSMVGAWPPADHYAVALFVWLLALDADLFAQHGLDLPDRKAIVRRSGEVLGSFALQDIPLVLRAFPDAHGLSLSPSAHKTFPAAWHDAARHSLGLAPAKASASSTKEIMMTASQAKKPAAPAKPKKAEKTIKERAPKGTGPKALVRGYLDEHKGELRSGRMARKEAVAHFIEQGINKASAGSWTSSWWKEAGLPAGRSEKKEAAPKKEGKPSGAATKAAAAKAKPSAAAKKEGKRAESAAKGADFAAKMKAAREAKKAAPAPAGGLVAAAS